MVFNYFDVCFCIISSYFYGYLSAFTNSHGVMTVNLHHISIFFDIWFFLAILKGFTTNFKRDGETQAEKKLKKIAWRYFDNEFKLDFICWIPIYEILNHDNHYRHSSNRV